MVALPFWLSTANSEFRANGWGSNIRTQAGLPVAGMMSEIVNQNFFQVVNDPASQNARVWGVWFDGTNTIFQINDNTTFVLCYGRPYINFVIPDQNSGDSVSNYSGGWILAPDFNSKLYVRYALFYGRRGQLTLCATAGGAGHRQTVILPWK